MRADYKSKLNPGGAGRMSSRLESKKTYREHLSSKSSTSSRALLGVLKPLLVINVKHMPNGKSTWVRDPACPPPGTC